MSTLSYHFAEFAIGAVRARARRYHPLRTPVSLSAGRASILRTTPPELRQHGVSTTSAARSGA